MMAAWMDLRMAAVKVDTMAERTVLQMVGKLVATTAALKAEMLVCTTVE